jgi:poly(3-hydroxybutyrate) depolymerase
VECRLHVFFHGCQMQSSNGVGTDFITESGFVQIADANNIVVLFPQVRSKLTFNEDSYKSKSREQICVFATSWLNLSLNLFSGFNIT